MQTAAVAPPVVRDGQEAIMVGAVSPGAPNTVFVPVIMQPQRQQRGLTQAQQLAMKVLGIMQVTIGALCIIISSVLASQWRTTDTDKAGAGIWCGIFFILPGAFALVSAATNKVGWIVTTMVMSIIGSLMLWNVLAFSSVSIDQYSRCTQYYLWFASYCGEKTGYTAADGLLIALSLIELMVAIWCAVVCCQSVCCRGSGCCSCCCDDPYGIQVSPQQMVYYANGTSPGMAGEQRVVVMPHPFTYGAGALGVTAAQHGFAGGQVLVTQSATTHVQQAYGPTTYNQQPTAGGSAPPNYYSLAGGGAAASWATVQQQPAPAAAAQPADAEKRYLAAGSSY